MCQRLLTLRSQKAAPERGSGLEKIGILLFLLGRFTSGADCEQNRKNHAACLRLVSAELIGQDGNAATGSEH
jgi:hypothetical protein